MSNKFQLLLMLTGLWASGCSTPGNDTILLEWQQPVPLPVRYDTAASFGYAGMIAGFQQQYLILAGGANFPGKLPWDGGKKHYGDAVFLFSVSGGQLHALDVPAQIPVPLAYAASCTVPGGVCVAGGENENGIQDAVYLIHFDDSLSKVDFRSLPQLPVPVTNAMMTCIGEKIYLLGGESASGTSAVFLMLDLKAPLLHWEVLPMLPDPVSHGVAQSLIIKGRPYIVLAGGRAKKNGQVSTFSKSVFRFDVENQQWMPVQEMPFPLSAAASVRISSSTLLITGGDKGLVFREVESLILKAAAEKDSVKKSKLEQQKAALQSGHKGFSKDILLYDALSDKWSITGSTPFPCPVTTTALFFNDQLILPSGEIRPGIRSPLIQVAKVNQ